MTMPHLPSYPEGFPVLCFLLCSIFTLFLFLKPKKKGVMLPPSPPRLPIIGNLHQLGKLHHRSLQKLSRKYGPIMLLQLGTKSTLVISSAEMAKEVLKTHDLDCCDRLHSPGPMKLFYGCRDVAFARYGDEWKNLRKLFVSEFLGAKRDQFLRKAREEEINRLITCLSLESSSPVNMDEKIYNAIDGIIGAFAYGKNYQGKQFKNETVQSVLNEAMHLLAPFTAQDFFGSVGWIVDALTGFHARLDGSFQHIHGYLKIVLEEHLDPARPQPDQEDFVDILVRLSKDETSDFPVTKQRIMALLADTLLGGIDTSALTLIWAMTELVKNTRVLNKLQVEIRSFSGEKDILNEEDVENFNYLKMVIKETLRLHSPVPLLVPHQTRQHCKIGGYNVYPETTILVNAWAIARDSKYWKNSEEFYPERFQDSEIDFRGNHFELLPFGAGRRVCPGLKMGVGTIELILANILKFLDWELPSGVKREDISIEEGGSLTNHRKKPLFLVPVKYEKL